MLAILLLLGAFFCRAFRSLRAPCPSPMGRRMPKHIEQNDMCRSWIRVEGVAGAAAREMQPRPMIDCIKFTPQPKNSSETRRRPLNRPSGVSTRSGPRAPLAALALCGARWGVAGSLALQSLAGHRVAAGRCRCLRIRFACLAIVGHIAADGRANAMSATSGETG